MIKSAYSLNRISSFDKNTKILIVGTLTPPEGMAHGYFYSSSSNPLFKFLSDTFEEKSSDDDSFFRLKRRLICEPKKQKKKLIINEINNKLASKKIGFFDVVSRATRKDDLSPNDSDINVISYAKRFYKQHKGNIKLIIFTSKNAEKWFKNIDKELLKNVNNYVLYLRRYKNNNSNIIQNEIKKIH